VAEDAEKYKNDWDKLLEPEFEAALDDLGAAWASANRSNGTVRTKKLQVHAESLATLFDEADKLGELWTQLLEQLARDHCAKNNYEFSTRDGTMTPATTFKKIGTKKIGRALQKVHRSYFMDTKTGTMMIDPWRKLCDLCRASLVFRPQEFGGSNAAAIRAMAGCIRAIEGHPDLEVIQQSDEKMRLRTSFESEAGYRDVQFCVRLKSAAAQAHGVDSHFAELQLHFGPIMDLKNGIKMEGGRFVKGPGGHANYVKARNLKGC